jgi:glycosyltransferase involved in cell wall biosynthesis
MKTEVLYISYDGMTDPLGQSQVIPYLAGLSAKGFFITLLSAEKKENYTKQKESIQLLLDKNGINWIPVGYTKRPPVFSTIFDIWKLTRAAKRIHREKNIAIVHCRSYISAFVGITLQKKGCRFVFDMRGFWPDERVDGNIWKLSNPIYKLVYTFFKHKERQFLEQADAIISLTEAAKQEMLQWKIPKLNAEKISVIPCCADFNHFDYRKISNQTSENWRTQLGIPSNSYVISYLGSVGTWYMPLEMLDFFNVLSVSKPDAIFLFITKDSPDSIIEMALKKGISQSQIRVQPATRNQVPELLSISNASLFFIKPVWSKKASSPTKMAEIMGMGIPVVTNSGVGDVELVMRQNPTGVLIESFTEEHYEKAVNQLLAFPDKKVTEVSELACKYFSLEQGISTFEKVYKILDK